MSEDCLKLFKPIWGCLWVSKINCGLLSFGTSNFCGG